MELTLPSNITSYEHQVAGHGCSMPSSKSVLYCREERCVYKPIQPPPKGDREADFYKAVFAEANGESPSVYQQGRQILAGLRPFLPKFFGVYRHPETGTRFLRLEDLLQGFSKPSVMDVKMGAKSYEPTASEEKRQAEIGKYAYRHEIGFFVTGLRVWQSDCHGEGVANGDSAGLENSNDKAAEGHFKRFSKRYGKDITPDNMHQLVIPPLIDSMPEGQRLRLLRQMIAQLEDILAWFNSQDLLHFYASSILLGVECCPKALADSTRPHVLVKMVDFTHTVVLTPRQQQQQQQQQQSNENFSSPDEGYLLGLRTLISLCHNYEKRLRNGSSGC